MIPIFMLPVIQSNLALCFTILWCVYDVNGINFLTMSKCLSHVQTADCQKLYKLCLRFFGSSPHQKPPTHEITSLPLPSEVIIFQVPYVAPHKEMVPHICMSSQFWLADNDTKLLVLNNYPVAMYIHSRL